MTEHGTADRKLSGEDARTGKLEHLRNPGKKRKILNCCLLGKLEEVEREEDCGAGGGRDV